MIILEPHLNLNKPEIVCVCRLRDLENPKGTEQITCIIIFFIIANNRAMVMPKIIVLVRC